MGPGVLHALARRPYDAAGALEVDEIWLPKVAREVRPRAVVLLNVTRDQLDRSNETRRIAGLWRALGGELRRLHRRRQLRRPARHLGGAGLRSSQVWVAAGQNWTADAMVCPACGSCCERGQPFGWRCGQCELHRPTPDVEVLGAEPDQLARRRRWRCRSALPGRVNVGNAAMPRRRASCSASRREAALAAMSLGARRSRAATPRRELAPAGAGGCCWPRTRPAGSRCSSCSTPSRDAARHRRLQQPRPPTAATRPGCGTCRSSGCAGRPVLVTGERREDVGVRLAYAGVAAHAARERGRGSGGRAPTGVLDVVANYTAFRDLLVRTGTVGCEAGTAVSASRPPGSRWSIPELLGTYGDGGNALVLATRLRWRGLAARGGLGAGRAPLPGPVRPLPAGRR